MTRLAVVTGGSRGIGRAVVRALRARGREVLAVGREQGPLAELARELGAHVQAADVCDAAGVSKVVDAARALGEVDALVCAAGAIHHACVGSVDELAMQRQLAVNLTAPVLLAQALAAEMRVRREGAVVFVTSTLAHRPAPGTLAYAASKAGLLAAMRGMAHELAPEGVRVNAVSPGVVDTDLARAPRGDGLEVEARMEMLRGLHPLGRLGTPDDVARTVVHALEAPWMTGSELSVDGGLLVG